MIRIRVARHHGWLRIMLCSALLGVGSMACNANDDPANGSGGHAGTNAANGGTGGGTAGMMANAGNSAAAGAMATAGTASTIMTCDEAAPGAPGCAPDPGDACDLSGTFVVHTVTKMHWPASKVATMTVIQAGDADLQSWGIWKLTQNGTALTSTMQGCGGQAPEICSPYFMQAFAQGIDNATWDAARVVNDVWQMQVDGTHVTSTPHATMLGIRMAAGADPLGAFPSSASAANLEWIDDDGDSMPGVTVSVHPPDGNSPSCALPYAYVPVDQKPKPSRTTTVYTGARTIQTLDMNVETCNLLRGSLNNVSISGRVKGCVLEGGQPCSATQAKFLDSQPNSQQVVSVSFTAVRVAEAPASCVDVRGFAFP